MFEDQASHTLELWTSGSRQKTPAVGRSSRASSHRNSDLAFRGTEQLCGEVECGDGAGPCSRVHLFECMCMHALSVGTPGSGEKNPENFLTP